MSLLDNIQRKLVNTVTGLSLYHDSNGNLLVYYATVSYIKDETSIAASGSGLDSTGAFLEKYDTKIPVWLTISGRNVITRYLNHDPEEQYLNHILPNVRDEDFVVSVYRTEDAGVYISAIRTVLFNSIITELKNSGLIIFGITLGPTPITILADINLLPSDKLHVPGYELEFRDNTLSGLHASESTTEYNYSINNEHVSSNLLIPFSTAISYLATQAGTDQLIGSTFTSNEEQYRGKRINQFIIYGALAFFFIMLLVNFMSFSIINSKHQALANNMSYQRTFFAQRDSLLKEINIKTNMVKQMGLTDNTTWGFYIDRIASKVPLGIKLDVVQVNPATDKIRPSEPIEFGRFIYIEGTSAGSIVLNEWIAALKALEWVHDIDIIHYEKLEGNGLFKLKITYSQP